MGLLLAAFAVFMIICAIKGWRIGKAELAKLNADLAKDDEEARYKEAMFVRQAGFFDHLRAYRKNARNGKGDSCGVQGVSLEAAIG